jgi:hypothetical protein
MVYLFMFGWLAHNTVNQVGKRPAIRWSCVDTDPIIVNCLDCHAIGKLKHLVYQHRKPIRDPLLGFCNLPRKFICSLWSPWPAWISWLKLAHFRLENDKTIRRRLGVLAVLYFPYA